MSTLVKVALVCRRLKVDAMRPIRWERAGAIKKAARGSYLLTELDAFLAECSRNFPEPITWEQLESKAVVLLRHDEAIAQFGVTQDNLTVLRRDKSVAYLSLPGATGSIRYCRASLEKALKDIEVALATPMVPSVLAQQAAEILGHATKQTILRLARQGVLQNIKNPHDPGRIYISITSLCVLLEKQLPPWITPLAWLRLYQDSQGSLVGSQYVATFLSLDAKQVTAHLTEHRAWFISSPDGKNIRVLKQWLDAQLGNNNRYSVYDIARLFDVALATVWEWLHRGLIVCPVTIHAHSAVTSFLWEPCWCAILEANSSPHTKKFARLFIQHRNLPEPTRLWGVKEAAVTLGCSHEDVIRLAEAGELFGVRTPAGAWRFNITQVKFGVLRNLR